MALFRSIATFALKNVAEGTVIAMGGEFAAGICEQVGGRIGGYFRDPSRVVLNALEKASEQALDTVESALAGSGLFGVLDAGEVKGLRTELETLLENHHLDGKPLDREWRKTCLKEWKAARKAGLFTIATELTTLEAALDPFTRFRNQADLVAAEETALHDLATAARDTGYPTLAQFLSIRPEGSSNLFALAVQHHFQCAIPKDHALFATLTHAQLKGLSAGQRETLSQVVDLHGKFDVLIGSVDEALRAMRLHDRALRLGDGLSIRTDAERRLVKQFRDLLRQHPPETLSAIDAEHIARLLHTGGAYDDAAPLLRVAAEFASSDKEKARAHHGAFVTALERRRPAEATDAFRAALALDPSLVPFDPVKRPVERVLGAGGFGIVVLCGKQYLKSHRTVFKLLRTEGLDRDPEAFMAEAQLLETIEHPNVIRVLNADIDTRTQPATPYLELEYFDGQDLDTFVREQGALAPDDAIAVALQIARGLSAAHEKGIWHRDVKPSNALVKKSESGFQVKLIDFGLAARQDEMATSLSLSRANAGNSLVADSLVGTLGYAAPEQLGTLKGVSVGPYSDLYGLGRTLCFLLFKKTEPLRKDWARLPDALASFVEECLEEDPKARFGGASADRVVQQLEALAAASNGPAATPTRPAEPQAIPPAEAAAMIEKLATVQVAKPGVASNPDDALGQRTFEGLRPLGKNPNSGLFEFWHPATGAEPRRRQDGHFRIEDDTGIVMVLLPGGEFWMGAQTNNANQPNYDPGADSDESPVNQVTLAPFFIAKLPMTQGQWKKVTGANPAANHNQPLGRERPLAYPVENVSWDDCSGTLQKVGLVLPTEAQWEYACRAGTSTPWCFGDEFHLEQNAAIEETSGERSAIVDALGANAFGLFHVHGNVWEWCQDWYQTYGSAKPRAVNGLRSDSGSYRVNRGGSFCRSSRYARSANRYYNDPRYRHYNLGCRPARVASWQ